MRVRLFKRTKDNLSYFQFLSANDQPVLNSQGYADKDDRNNGVRSVISNASNADRYERQVSAEGKNYFLLKASNGQEIARSVEFDTAAAMEAAIASCVADIGQIVFGEEGEVLAAAPATERSADGNPYDGSDGDDNYKRLAFYQSRIKGVENGFDSFATEEGKFYFTLNLGGKIVLLSEIYNSADGRNNGSESVAKNLPLAERYQRMVHPNGKHYFNLLAGNNQQIATSIWFDSEAEMNDAIRSLQGGLFGEVQEVVLTTAGEGVSGDVEGMTGYQAHVEIAAPPHRKEADKPKEKKKIHREKKEKSGDEKVYLRSGEYLFNGVTYQTMRAGNGKHYFSFRTAEGKSLFNNANVAGFETEEEMDAAVQRVMDLGPYEGNFEGKTTVNGKYYFYLNDTDGKAIGKSFFYDTTEEMQSAIGLLIGRVRIAAAEAPQAITTEAMHDDYLPCESYAGVAGFHKFFNADDESWYFAFNDENGNTYLRSEGYSSEKARDNGIEERWVTDTDAGGYSYFALRAGNNQEIARSCPYDEEGEMVARLAWLRGEESIIGAGSELRDGVRWSVGMIRRKREEEEAAARAAEEARLKAEAEAKAAEEARLAAEAKAAEEARLKAEAEAKAAEDARLAAEAEAAATAKRDADAAAAAAASNKVEDDYLICRLYKERIADSKSEKYPGFITFQHENGKHYFGWLDDDGDLLMRGEGYPTMGARDNGIESVIRNRDIEERYSVEERHGAWFTVLKAGNHQEIARSCPSDSEAVCLALFPAEREKARAAKLAAAAPVAARVSDKLADDYLPCDEYRRRIADSKSAKYEGFITFQHENGKHYFAWLDEDGDMRMRGEGYPTTGARDNGIESVIRNRDIEERYSAVEVDGRWYTVLKAGNHQEIARSCSKDSNAAALAWFPGARRTALAAAAAAAAAAIPVVVPPVVVEEKKKVEVPVAAAAAAAAATVVAGRGAVAPKVEKKVEKVVAAPPPPPKVVKTAPVVPPPPPPVAASTGGGFKWWWLLPLLLIPLFFLLRGCDGCGKPATDTAVVAPPPPPVAVDTVKKEETPPPPPPAPTCACKGSDNAIFNIPDGATPKQLSRLGTNPEFGDSHELDGAGFYAKIANNAKRFPRDKKFLDGIFKAMGYANGFADAKPEMFTEVTVPSGTSGNMGYSAMHKTLYATVPANERDRLAFRIKSANGCDLHFMKTCGNHFFYCTN